MMKLPTFSEPYTVELFNSMMGKMGLPPMSIDNDDVVRCLDKYSNTHNLSNKISDVYKSFNDDIIERQFFMFPYIVMLDYINKKKGVY